MITNIIASAAVIKLIYELVINNDTANIKSDKIFNDFLVVNPTQELRTLKGMMTKRINNLIDQGTRFKIGKTGNPDERFTKYSNYSRMYLLCQTTEKELIEILESYLNDKYCIFQNCDNVRGGSAGIMTNKHSLYFLYLVIE